MENNIWTPTKTIYKLLEIEIETRYNKTERFFKEKTQTRLGCLWYSIFSEESSRWKTLSCKRNNY